MSPTKYKPIMTFDDDGLDIKKQGANNTRIYYIIKSEWKIGQTKQIARSSYQVIRFNKILKINYVTARKKS